MSTTVDNKVVEMRFDNKQFEKNASQSISTLERLKQALKFDKSSTNSLLDLQRSTKDFQLNSISESVDKISDRFSALGVVGVTALQKITNQAIDTAERLVRSLTFDQISSGFQKYEATTNAVQVMMVNTGESIEVVNQSLAKLQKYADDTSYSYSQMTDAIGKFTTAGIGLEQAEEMAEGIANWAASAGVNAQKASGAFYNLAQAVGAGALKAMDAKSLNLLNMFTPDFNKAVLESAVAVGTLRKEADRYFTIAKGTEITVGGLANQLTEGWLDNDVLADVLHKYADTTQEFGKKMFDAAYEAKTFTDALEAVKETVSTGWAGTYEIIFGNYEEAKLLWTELATLFQELLGGVGAARNEVLLLWKQFGGRDQLIRAFGEALRNVLLLLEPIKRAANDIFGSVDGKKLAYLSMKLKELMIQLRPSEELIESLYYGFSGLFSVIDAGLTVLKGFVREIAKLFSPLQSVFILVMRFVGLVGYLLTFAVEYAKATGALNRVVTKFGSVLATVADIFGGVLNVIIQFVKAVADLPVVQEIFAGIVSGLQLLYTTISSAFSRAGAEVVRFTTRLKNLKKEDIAPYLNVLSNALRRLLNIVKPVGNAINTLIHSFNGKESIVSKFSNGFSGLINSAKNFLKGGSIIEAGSKKLQSLKDASASLSVFEDNFHGFVQRILERVKELEIGRKIVLAFGAAVTWNFISLGRSIAKLPKLMDSGIKTVKELRKTIASFNQTRDSVGDTIIKISAAIAILAGSVFLLSKIPAEKLGPCVTSIIKLMVVFGLLSGLLTTAGSIESFASNFEKTTTALIEMSGSILILVLSLKVLDTLDSNKIRKNITNIGYLIADLIAVGFIFSKFNPASKANALVMVGFAFALSKVVNAVAKLAALPESQIQAAGDSIQQLMLLLTGLTLAVSKINFGAGAGLLAIVASLYLLEGALWTIAKIGIGLDTVFANIDKFVIIFGALAGLMAITRLAGKEALGAGIAAIGISFALLSMTAVVGVMVLLAALNPNALLIGVLGLIGLTGGVWVLMKAISETKNASIKAGIALIPLSASLILMAGAVRILSKLGVGEILKGLGAVAVLTLFAAGLVYVSKLSAKANFMPIIGMVAAVVAIAGSLALLSLADPQGLEQATGAIFVALLGFSAGLLATSRMAEKINIEAIAGLVVMIGALVAASTAIATLATLPWEGLVAAAGSLSVLLIAMSFAGSMADIGIKTAFSFVVLSAAIIPLAYALMMLKAVSLSEVSGGLEALLGFLAVGAAIGGIPIIAAGLETLALVLLEISGAAGVFAIAVKIITDSLIELALNAPQVIDTINGLFRSLADGIIVTFAAIGSGLAVMVGSFFSTLITIIVTGIDGIVNAVKNKNNDISDAGTSLVSSLAAGLIAGLPLPIQAAVSVVGAIGSIFTGKGGLADTLTQAGNDAALGLSEGMKAGEPTAEKAGENLGKSTEKGFRDYTGWHSPWTLLLPAMKDAGQALLNGAPMGAVIAEAAGNMVGAAAGDGVIDALNERISVAQDILANFSANSMIDEFLGNSGISTTKWQDEQKQRQADEDKIWAEYERREKLKKAGYGSPTSGITGGKKGGSGGGGGASAAAKEVKKLFDVMKDGDKVIQKFAENFGDAYEQLGYTHPLELGKDAVQKLAETIYAESVKSVDAAEQAAKSTEDKLAEMREAFISFHDSIKSTIDGSIDNLGKFAEKTAEPFSDWIKNLKKQKAGVQSWVADIKRLANRTKDYNLVKMFVDYGPEEAQRLRQVLAQSDETINELKALAITGLEALGEESTNEVLAALASTQVETEKKVEDIVEETNKTVEEGVDKTTDTIEEGVNKYVVANRNGAVAVVNEVGKIIKANEAVGQSAFKMAEVTQQTMQKVKNTYLDVQSAVKSAVESNFDIFEKFNTETELTGDDLLDNMKSQVHGAREWADGISTLIGRGLDEGLVKKLYESGQASYEQVQAMLEWSEDELNKANSLYQQSVTLADEVATQIGQDMATAALLATQGFVSNFNPDPMYNQAKEAASGMVATIINNLDDPNFGMPAVGKAYSDGAADSIEANSGEVTNAAVKAMNETVVTSKATAESGGRSIGENYDRGIAQGMYEFAYLVTNAANEVTRVNAIGTTEDEAEVHSPSRVFAKIGRFMDMGLANGLIDNASLVSEASGAMGDRAIDSMRAVVGHIADIINGEVQLDPTIRPVVDLSGVEDGASAIGSIFGGRSYSMTRGINIQNHSDSVNDMISQMMARQAAGINPAGGSPINMYVYAAPGQSEEEIANIVEQKLMFRINRTGAVWS